MSNVNNRKVYVVGHKNPDTDSICSAIAYAELKTTLTGQQHVARRAGPLNEETHYILDRFHVEEPPLLVDLRVQIRDVSLHYIDGINGDLSVKEAWKLMEANNVKTLPIIKDQAFVGLITGGDIVTSYMSEEDDESLAKANTPYKNVLQTIQGTLLNGDEDRLVTKGKVEVAASSRSIMEEFIGKDDICILGDRQEAHQIALDLDVGCLIICHHAAVSDEILKQAKEKDVMVISTPLDPFSVSRLINQSIPVSHHMSTDNLVTFRLTDFTDDVKVTMSQNKYRDFPVLNDYDQLIGFVSRRRLITSAGRKQVILVDHNELNQAVDGVQEADVLEIIDHHRLRSVETMAPVFFRNQPVGCTCTIIYQMYQESLTKLNKTTAALMCAAIISDTLMFRSPTCTPLDEYSARQLSQIAGIDIIDLANGMFNAGSNLRQKTPEEIVTADFKLFTVNNITIGVGQLNSLNIDELRTVKENVSPVLDKVRKAQRLDMIFFMLTSILDESTELICAGQGARELATRTFDLAEKADELQLKGVVSRKMQLVPTLVSGLQM